MDNNVLELMQVAFDRYFNSLRSLGYLSDDKVESLLILSFIQEVLYKSRFSALEECQYRILIDALYCLMGSNCLIDFTQLSDIEYYIGNIHTPYNVRISEDYILRESEDSQMREPIL